MRILALETDIDKLNTSLLSPGERIVLQARFHGFLFVMRALGAALMTLALLAFGIGAGMVNIPTALSVPLLVIVWVWFVLRPLLRAFIDWQYDELLVTTEKIILVNQSSIIRQEIQQMNLENLASVRALTQFGGVLPFGKLQFELKEGTGKGLRLRYIPNAQQACSTIGNCIVQFQRRQANASHP